MSEYPEDVMKAARDASLLCIGGMCSTYRHDYGLLPENERKALYVTMSQLAYHDVAPVIARAILAERERCAGIVRETKALNADEKYLLGKVAKAILSQPSSALSASQAPRPSELEPGRHQLPYNGDEA